MIRNLERFFLLLLLLLLPTQLAYHYWPAWSLVHGIRVDYLSPTLYLTDLIILALFLLSRFRVRVPLSIIVFTVLNILISYSPNIAIYSWLRLLEFYWLFKYLTKNSLVLSTSHLALSLAVLWTSLLAWSQFFFQRSVGGPLYWLGERAFNIGTPGIATISLAGRLFLRPYATLPHPNALAGFLLVAGLIIFYLRPKSLLSHISILISALTIPLTFSRTAIILEIMILGFWVLLKIKKIKLKIFFSGLLLLLLLQLTRISSPSSLSDRLALNQKAILAISKNLLIGVGLGNFIPAAAHDSSFIIHNSFLTTQPVHNIYLLLASELGLPATIALSLIVIRSLSHLLSNDKFLIICAFTILLSGAVDHYWLTLHQNQLLLTVILALLVVKSGYETEHIL